MNLKQIADNQITNLKRISIVVITAYIMIMLFLVSAWSMQKHQVTKWEYTTGKCDQADLDAKGQEGWEMVDVADTKWTTMCCCKVYYKRPKK